MPTKLADAASRFRLKECVLIMTQTVESLFDEGIERYKAGESPETLIPVFKEICDRSRKSSPAWTCLAWLYLLVDKPTQALDSAQKAVKLNPQDPQARVNLAVAMLETSKKGVRQHVEIAQQLMMAVPELRDELGQSIEDGLARKPDWASLLRVKNWLFE
jgi:predicted Zn-dependent protease